MRSCPSLSSGPSRTVLAFLLLSSFVTHSQAERSPRVLVPRQVTRPVPAAPSRGPATNQPDGHRALAQELRARGLSGAYQQLVFHDDRRGAVRTLSPRAVKNFWHDGGRWRYRHGA